jgi:hypothetical protein
VIALLVVPAWLTLAWTLITWAERTTPPAARIVGAYRDVHVDVPPHVRPAWLDQPDDTETWTYRSRRRQWPTTRSTSPTWPGPAFPDPPPPAVFRVPRVDPLGRIPLTTSVAAALGPA